MQLELVHRAIVHAHRYARMAFVGWDNDAVGGGDGGGVSNNGAGHRVVSAVDGVQPGA